MNGHIFILTFAVCHIVSYFVGVSELDMDNFQLSKQGTFSGMQAYKNSKLCNILSAYQLADSLQGTGVSVNAVNPGEFAFPDYLVMSNVCLY